jgi:PAS domain S-box-containing protein
MPTSRQRRDQPIDLHLVNEVTSCEGKFTLQKNTPAKTKAELLAENAELRARLEEAENLARSMRARKEKARAKETQVHSLKDALLQSESLVQALVDNAPFEFWVRDATGRCIIENSFTVKHWGSLLGTCPETVGISPGELELWQSNNRRAMAGEVVEGEVQYPVDGQTRFFHNIIAPIRVGEEIRGIMGLNIDITERKQAEVALRQSEQRYRALFELESDAIVLVDNESGRLLAVNRSAMVLYGFSREELLTMRNTDLSAEPAKTKVATNSSPVCLEAPICIPLRYHRKKDGTVFPVEITGHFFQCEGRAVHIAAIRDITERKRAEEAIEASLLEKEAMLKEIHHRVKNNLQVISSLLRLQSEKLDNPIAKDALGDMQNRVRSMALIHENLYRSENLAAVDLSIYLKQLCLELFRALALHPADIRLHLDFVPARMEIERSIPCGLLVNELLSNALRHAFPDGRKGEVRIELILADEGRILRLKVSDNGVGLPSDFVLSKVTSLGLVLASSLSLQIGGVLDIGAGPGAVFEVAFPSEYRVSTA